MQFLIAVAWRNLWRHGRRSLITAVAMAFGVGMCMASLCFQDGMFLELFDVMVEQRLGHVQVNHPEYPSKRVLHDTIGNAGKLVADIEAIPDTVAVSPRLNGFGLVGGEEKSSGAMIVGIEPGKAAAATPLENRVVEGDFLDAAESGQTIIGHKLAKDLEVGVGDSVVVVTQASDGSLGNAVFDVVGLYKSGDAQMDRAGMYATLGDVQDLLVLPDQIHQATLVSNDANAIDTYAGAVASAIGSDAVEVLPWWTADPQTAQMMDLRDVGAAILLVIVFGAAAFGVLNTMMMSVFERTRELGVLRALGLRGGRLVALVLVESAFLAALACAIGLVIGGLFDWYLVTVGFDMSSAAGDGFEFNGVMLDPVIHGAIRVQSIVIVVVAVFVVSLLASLYPAYRAASLRPVEAIRSE